MPGKEIAEPPKLMDRFFYLGPGNLFKASLLQIPLFANYIIIILKTSMKQYSTEHPKRITVPDPGKKVTSKLEDDRGGGLWP